MAELKNEADPANPQRHAYPAELAAFVLERLPSEAPRPTLSVLAALLSTAYQASLLREEGRAVTFRMCHQPADPAASEPAAAAAPLRVRLEVPRPYHEQELRRISPAARLSTTLVGVSGARPDELQIWGLVHVGASREADGVGNALADALVVSVTAPGCVLVEWSGRVIGRLTGGVLTGRVPDVFASAWLPAACTEPQHAWLVAAVGPAESHLPLRALARRIDQQFVSRLVASVRQSGHGGTVVLLPHALTESVVRARRPIALKYPFVADPARSSYRTLAQRLLGALELDASGLPWTWERYRQTTDPSIRALDGAFVGLARGIADLAAVDGVVLLSKRFEVMGFGGEIVGDLPDVRFVMRALDLEGERTERESTEAVGTRHRSVYRLTAAVPQALSFVSSQDGSVRLVAQKGGVVTYWDQLEASIERL